jgi:hypothetical protein
LNKKNTPKSDTPAAQTETQEKEPENGIFRTQKSYTIDSISFTRHQVVIREGQNEETITYTVFEDKNTFAPLNEAIADYMNLVRLDSMKISYSSNLDGDDSEYEAVQRIDTIYFGGKEFVNVEMNYSFMANGAECENKDRQFLAYSLKTQKILTLKDIFGAKLPQAQKTIHNNLKDKFLKEVANFAENAYHAPDTADIGRVKKQIQNPATFFENMSFMATQDSLIFSYPINFGCSLPPYLRGSCALKDLEK